MADVLPIESFRSGFRTPAKSSAIVRTPVADGLRTRFQDVQLNLPKSPVQSVVPDSTFTKSSDDEVKQAEADKQINDYIAFIAQQQNPTGSLEEFVKEARRLFTQLESLIDVNAESVSLLQTNSTVLGAVSFVSLAEQDGAISSEAGAVVSVRSETRVSGEIRLSNGTVVRFESSATVQLTAAAVFRIEEQVAPVLQGDPLALDLDQDGQISMSGIEQGIRFDIEGNGELDQTAFIHGGDGFLAWDRNGNATIDSGKELFGDQHGAANGFLELAKFDDDQNGQIDSADGIFSELLIVQRGSKQPLKVSRLADFGIQSLALNFMDTNQQISGGNRLTQTARYYGESGAGLAADVLLLYRPLSKDA